jgi:hypothetical protein
LGKQDVQPPAILFSIFAKLPMKWWAFGESHHVVLGPPCC